MKKIMGMLLGLVLVVTFIQTFDFMFAPTVASAMTNGGSNNTPGGGGSTDKGTAAIDDTYQNPGPNEPIPDTPGAPLDCRTTPTLCPTPPAPAPVPPRADCQTYNGSTRYPVDSGVTCQGTIQKQDGSTFDFSCPPIGDRSAIYVTYNEELYYNTRYLTIYNEGIPNSVVPTNTTWTRLTLGGLRTFGGERYKILQVHPWALSTATYGGSQTFSTGDLGWTTSQARLNNFYNTTFFNWRGYQQIYVQSTVPVDIVSKVDCKYPYKPTVQPLYSVVCFLYYDSSLYKSDSKDGIRLGGAKVDSRSGLKAGNVADINNPNNYGVTLANHLSCNNDTFQTREIYDLASPEAGGYGYYRMQAELYATRCFVEGYPTWTQNHDKDRLTGCSGTFLYNTYNTYATYSCNGFIQTGQGNVGWSTLPANENFAVSACEAFNCDITGSLEIGGTSAPLQVMRNGENIPATYPSVSANAGGSPNARPANGAPDWDSVTEAASGVTLGSSPFKTGIDINSSKQYFGLRTSENNRINFLSAREGDKVNANSSNPSSAWVTKLQSNGQPNPNFNSGYVNYNWASSKNLATGQANAWNMFRTFRVNGEFFVPVADGTNGNTTMQWQKETKYCGNVISNPVTVVRSVNEMK